MEKNMTLLIMAAGMGSRFGGLKQIEAVGPSNEFIIDYSVYDAIVAGLYVGHCHRDYYEHADAGYFLVSTTCDANGAQASFDYKYPTRTKGTTTEQAFDVVFFNPKLGKINTIRIGAGANREFTYPTSNVPVPVESVSLNSNNISMGVGRTKTPFIYNIIGMWGVRILGTFIFTQILGYGLVAAWACMIAHNVLLCCLYFISYVRGKWNPLNNI